MIDMPLKSMPFRKRGANWREPLVKLEPHRSEEAIVKVVGPAFFAFLFINARISAGDSNISLEVASIVSEFEVLTGFYDKRRFCCKERGRG